MYNNFVYGFYLFIRPLIKWFLHKFTKLCELQRICYGAPTNAERVTKVKRSLELSKHMKIKKLIIYLDAITSRGLDEHTFKTQILNQAISTVMIAKRINPRIHVSFAKSFGLCVTKIWGYKNLYYTVESMRTTLYDSDNADHENKLNELWYLLMGDTKLESRITKQWQDIGFQGDDPKTDFRGMGILGLENLLYFAREFKDTSLVSQCLSHSHHPVHGYTFAIVGINLTSMAYRLLKSGALQTHFYNVNDYFLTINTFHEFYCYLFYEFDRFWLESKPNSIMDFSFIQTKFEKNIIDALGDNKCLFKIHLPVKII